VTDEEMDLVAVRANLGTGKDELGKVVDVLMDKTMEFGYNHPALPPDLKEAAKLSLRVGLFLSPE
jgi:hypothetical protein